MNTDTSRQFHWQHTDAAPKFAYRLAKNHNDRPVLLFFHGGPGDNCAYFSACCGRQLEERYTMLWVDQPGCGHSPRNIRCDDQDPNIFIESLHHLLEQLSLPPAIALGHSWGGMLAGMFASQMPCSTRALINVCGPASFPQMLHNLLLRVRAYFHDNAKVSQDLSQIAKLQPGFEFFTRLFHYAHAAGLYYKNQRATHAEMGVNIRSTLGTGEYDEQSLGDADDTLFAACEYHSLLTIDITPQLSSVKCPALIIGGTHDCIVDYSCLETYRAAVRHSQLKIFANSGHNPFQEEPEQFLEVIDNFITRLS